MPLEDITERINLTIEQHKQHTEQHVSKPLLESLANIETSLKSTKEDIERTFMDKREILENIFTVGRRTRDDDKDAGNLNHLQIYLNAIPSDAQSFRRYKLLLGLATQYPPPPRFVYRYILRKFTFQDYVQVKFHRSFYISSFRINLLVGCFWFAFGGIIGGAYFFTGYLLSLRSFRKETGSMNWENRRLSLARGSIARRPTSKGLLSAVGAFGGAAVVLFFVFDIACTVLAHMPILSWG